MKRYRYIVYFLVGSSLLGLNIFQWSDEEQENFGEEKKVFVGNDYQEEDFVLRNVIKIDEDEKKIRRNLVLPSKATLKEIAIVEQKVQKSAIKTLPTLEEIMRQSAEEELARLKLIGVVFKNRVGEAFVVDGKQLYVVSENDKLVDGRFTVDKVTIYEIFLSDSFSTVTGKIPVSGY